MSARRKQRELEPVADAAPPASLAVSAEPVTVATPSELEGEAQDEDDDDDDDDDGELPPLAADVRHLLALRAFAPLEQLALDDLATLSQLFDEQIFPRRTTLITPGQRVPSVYFILDGKVAVERHGRTVIVEQGGIGFLELLAGEPQTSRASALTDVVALIADPDLLLDVFDENFNLLLDALTNLARELTGRLDGSDWMAVDGDLPPPPADRDLDVAEKMMQLTQNPWLRDGCLEAGADLARIATEERRAPGQTLWRSGDPADAMWLILDGEVRGGRHRARRGHMIGGIEALAGMPRRLDANARTPLRALRISVEDMIDVIEDQPELGLAIMRGLATEILRLTDAGGRP